MFDLAKLDVTKAADKGATVQLTHPVTEEVLMDSKGKPVTITVLGADSKVFKDAIKARARASMNKRNKTVDFDEAERKASELLAKCTIGWSGIVENGKDLEFSYDNAVTIYTTYSWIKEQVDAAIGDRANFIKA